MFQKGYLKIKSIMFFYDVKIASIFLVKFMKFLNYFVIKYFWKTIFQIGIYLNVLVLHKIFKVFLCLKNCEMQSE